MSVHPSSSVAAKAVRRLPDSSRLNARLDLIDQYTAAWENGRPPDLNAFLARLDPADSEGRVELVYRDFCLAEVRGEKPVAERWLERFSDLHGPLGRLLALHAECPSSFLSRLVDPDRDGVEWPEGGDWIGAYRLKRELGRGAFARVFLAEQADLENRLVVLKITLRPSKEAHLLARARHAHIVEVEAQEPVNDGAFHLIRMPFWGGATLAAVLEVRRDRGAPGSGRDLLDDLDLVAAPEYPAVQTEQPAREILAGLSYEQAVAWLAARLAAALDHAFRKAVVHGDVKPSNIVLAADGAPMLLDFNLAQDGSGIVPEGGSSELGGTLAYMAPERLARLDREQRSPVEPADYDAHRADLYSLGMVLLEALTGRPPELLRPTAGGGLKERPRLADWARARQTPGTVLIRQAERAGRPISRGLKTILSRCLDLDPGRRYHHARELAEDLDRWRADRAPAFAAESFLGDQIPRFVRRKRRMLTAAATTFVVVATAAVLVARFVSSQSLASRAQEKMRSYISDLQGGAYAFQRPGATPVHNPVGLGPGRSVAADRDRRVVEVSLRAIKDYGLLEPGDWRDRDDVQALPSADRADLELWLLEQTYRYCRALAARVDSPADWERALVILDQVAKAAPLQAYDSLARSLEAKLTGLGLDPPRRRPPPAAVDSDPDLYLLGVAREYDALDPGGPNPKNPPPLVGALEAFEDYLARRSGSYWGHYRAASAAFALERFEQAAVHLRHCLVRWPANAALHLGLSACLAEMGEYDDALRECAKAEEGAPDYPEIARSRAFIRASSGDVGGLRDDIQRFETLARLLPSEYWRTGGGSAAPTAKAPPSATLPGLVDLARSAFRGDPLSLRGARPDIEPEEIHFRGELATRILYSGENDLAAFEYTKILVLDPGDLPARINRALWEVESKRFQEADQDLDAVFKHPGLVGHLASDPDLINSLLAASHAYLRHGRLDDSRDLARRSLDLAIAIKANRGNCHFALARAYAVTARTRADFLTRAVKQLDYAFQANPHVYQRAYARDSAFDPVRTAIDAALKAGSDRGPHPRKTTAGPLAQTR